MDNILKLLLGVLGIAGLIAMVTSNLTFEPPQPLAAGIPPSEVITGPPAGEDDEAIMPEEGSEEGLEELSPEEDGEDVFAIGEPLIDGNPYGSNIQPQPQNEGQMQYDGSQAGTFNYGGVAQQNYAPQQQQFYPPQSPVATIGPVNSGQ